jgi:hypothetical protein
MATRRSHFPYVDGARHPADWRHDRLAEESMIQPGDRMFARCESGPSISRLETYPPQLEIEERGHVQA